MDKIDTARAAHLFWFLDFLRDIGAPVDSTLERTGLPSWVEESPNARIPTHRIYELLTYSAALEAEDLDWQGAKRFLISPARKAVLDPYAHGNTIGQRLMYFARNAALVDDEDLQITLEQKAGIVRLSAKTPSMMGSDGYKFSEWIQIAGMIGIIREGIGEHWEPDIITIRSPSPVADSARSAFPGTRFVTGGQFTAITFSSSFLTLGTADHTCQSHTRPVGGTAARPRLFFETVRDVMSPYLQDGYPPIQQASEVLGISVRSLQRRLAEDGVSYSQVIEQIRFDQATKLLKNADETVTDVALSLGYTDQSNFTRAFRRIGGLTPREFRKQSLLSVE